MKNEVIKKILKISIFVIVGIIGLFILDFLILKMTGAGPFLSIRDKENQSFRTPLYTVYKCDSRENNKDYVIRPFNYSYDCDVHNMKEEFIIVDETENCAEALEEIARDDLFIYYLPCVQSETIFIKYKNGNKITIKKALETKEITILELKKLMEDKIYVEVKN